MSGTPRRSLGRPRNPAKAEAVLTASWRLFLKHGVEAVTVDQIAAEAGVAKLTVYAYFADKRALFREGVKREMAKIEASQFLQNDDFKTMPIRDQLITFGTGLMNFWTSESAVDFYSSLSGELRRNPELSQLFYENGPGRTLENLASILSGPAASELSIPDPREAAEMLCGMWQGLMNYRLMLGIGPNDVVDSTERRVLDAVNRFIIAYSPAKKSGSVINNEFRNRNEL